MKKNYLKIGLIALVLAGMVAPLAIGMAVDRPVTKIERCTLRHDFSKQFGSDDYKQGNTIAAEAIVTGTGGTGGAGTGVWPAGVEVVWTEQQYNSTMQSKLRTAIATFQLNVALNCQASVDALDTGDHKITKARFDDINGCKTQKLGVQYDPPGKDSVVRAMLAFLSSTASSQGTVGGAIIAEDAAIVCMLDLIETVGDWLFAVVLIFAGIFILWGGATMVFAAGSPEKIKKARDILIW
ncbi:MAG: hypothetical protein AAB620_01255, partial [Patescibacteria group bacterium]